jgi:hypothetical protein
MLHIINTLYILNIHFHLITHLYLILVPKGMQLNGLLFHGAHYSLLFLFLMPWGFIPSGLTHALDFYL